MRKYLLRQVEGLDEEHSHLSARHFAIGAIENVPQAVSAGRFAQAGLHLHPPQLERLIEPAYFILKVR